MDSPGKRCLYCFREFPVHTEEGSAAYSQHLQQHVSRAAAGKWSRAQGLSDNDRRLLRSLSIRWDEDA